MRKAPHSESAELDFLMLADKNNKYLRLHFTL